MSSIDSIKLYSVEKQNNLIAQPFILKSLNSNKTLSRSLSKESLDFSNLELDDSNFQLKIERQGSMTSSIDSMSSRKPSNDSFLSYLKSESPCNLHTKGDKGKNQKIPQSDDQLELVNFIPGAMIRKKENSRNHLSANYSSSESINTITESKLLEDNKSELYDSKHLEAKSNLIFDQYLKLLTTAQTRESKESKESTKCSFDMIQKLCSPKLDNIKEGLSAVNFPSGVYYQIKTNESNSVSVESSSYEESKLRQILVNSCLSSLNSSLPIPIKHKLYYQSSNYTNTQLMNERYEACGKTYHGVSSLPTSEMTPSLFNNTKPQKSNQLIEVDNINNQNPLFLDNGKIDLTSILNIISDQHECRNLQSQLQHDPSFVHQILPQILQHFVILSCDPYGNYLIQKVIECINQESLTSIIEMANQNFLILSLHKFGTRVIQRLIQCIDHIQIGKFTRPLSQSIQVLYKSPNGIHVIFKYVNKGINVEFVYDFIHSNIRSVSTNEDGCCLVQKILEISSVEQRVSFLNLL